MGKMLHEENENKERNVSSELHKQQGTMNNQNSHVILTNQQQLHSNNQHIYPTLTHSNEIIYLYSSPSPTFLSTSIQLFNLYKRFVQNTIIQLGEDWRIQSGLLAQEIINEKNLTNDQFCIFNQFMAGFLRAKIIQQQLSISRSMKQQEVVNRNNFSEKQSQYKTSQSKEQQQQYEFLKYFCRTLPYNNNTNENNNLISMNNSFHNPNILNSNVKIQVQTDFSNNLTFKTLSLGFYITAGDIWMRMFNKYHKVEVQEGINRIHLNNNSINKIGQQQKTTSNNKLVYFASLCTNNNTNNNNNNNKQSNNNSTNSITTQQWSIHQQQQIYTLLTPYQSLLMNENKNSSQNLRKSIKLGSVIVNIQQTLIDSIKTTTGDNNSNEDTINNNQNQNQNKLTIRQLILCQQFYTQLFLVWLIFSIKKSFNSTLFPSSCFIRYCDIIIGSRIFQENQKEFVKFHSIYRQFKLLCDSEWKKLMKDYMVALNDDKQVLRVLVKRIEEQLVNRFNRQMQGKKGDIVKIVGNSNNKN